MPSVAIRFALHALLCRSALALLLGLLALGCDKPQQANIVTTNPRDTSDQATPNTLPARGPAESVMLIDGKPMKFPPARLLLQQAEPTVDLLLVSDDKADVLHPRWNGNRFYLPLHGIDVPLNMLASHEVRSRAPSMDRRDIPDGIFLDGDKRHLQPCDVRILFAQNGEDMVLHIEGQFIQFYTREQLAPPRLVTVSATLAAELEKLQPAP